MSQLQARIDILDTSTSRKVDEGVDPVVRKAFLEAGGHPVDPVIQAAIDAGVDLNNEEIPPATPAPKFKEGQLVYHRGSGEKCVVIGAVHPCRNPDHRQAHEEGARFDSLPDCRPEWSGEYVVSPGAGRHVLAVESELVEMAADPGRGTLNAARSGRDQAPPA